MQSSKPQDNSNPRRRKKSKKQIFMEVYMPAIALGAVVLFALGGMIAGLVARDCAEEEAKQSSVAEQEESKVQIAQERAQAEELMGQAKHLAESYDYEGAIALLDSFGKKIYDHEDMVLLRDGYRDVVQNMQVLTGRDVVHLSVQVLIAQPERAFADPTYGNSYKRNFISTREFSNLLDQLYEGGYVLIDMDDILERRTDENGRVVLKEKILLLPQGKKPLLLTQTQVNYYTYMVDPNEDGIPDQNGAGFASKLIYEDGKFQNELVSADGETMVGNYDMVPILEEFLEAHPDFSYRGARAILAVTGYNGVFGYRSDTLMDGKPVVDALWQTGYEMAYYTYYNSDYSSTSPEKIQEEAERWRNHIVPVLGLTPYMVYALSGDIAAPNTAYSGDKFAVLQNQGFRYYLGFCTDGKPWFRLEDGYVRMGRILANAENLSKHSEWFQGICDPSAVLVEQR